MKSFIPVYQPYIDDREQEYLMSAIKNKEISGSGGYFLQKFENDFSKYLGCKQSIACSNATSALHLATNALGLGESDEVLVQSFTNMVTFFVVLYQGAKPIPVDIEPDTWNINPDLIEQKITKKTKAIIVVHIYGHPVDMDPVMEIAEKHDLRVIEDCAEAHGATYKGKKVGTIGDIGCFSFYANKIITTGEGGMVTTNNETLAKKIRNLKNLGFGDKNKFMHENIGFNYKMSNILAAIGCAQLEKIEDIISKKRKAAHYYSENLQGIPGLQLPVEKPYARNVYWMYNVVLHEEFGLSRENTVKKLSELGIETRNSFIPYNMQEIILKKGWVKENECPVANYVGTNGFYIPSGPSLTVNELRKVVNAIQKVQTGKA
jgi:perosamine synthetase